MANFRSRIKRMIGKEVLLNTIKISMAATLAILLAMLIKAEYEITAGVIAILSIQRTKKETLNTALSRVLALICSLLISYACYSLMGFTIWAFVLFLLLFVFVCQMFGWSNSMSLCSVLMSHFLFAGNMSRQEVVNECQLFLIGVSVGIVANMHLHKDTNYIEELKEITDNQMRNILHCLAQWILDKNLEGDVENHFKILRDAIRKAKNVADTNYNNQLGKKDIYDKEYIRMRDRQYLVLYEMYKVVKKIHTTPITAKRISDFLEEVSKVYHKTNTCRELMEHFQVLNVGMKSQPLPLERVEFEDRAKLFFLLQYIEEFLQIKIDFAEKYLEE